MATSKHMAIELEHLPSSCLEHALHGVGAHSENEAFGCQRDKIHGSEVALRMNYHIFGGRGSDTFAE